MCLLECRVAQADLAPLPSAEQCILLAYVSMAEYWTAWEETTLRSSISELPLSLSRSAPCQRDRRFLPS